MKLFSNGNRSFSDNFISLRNVGDGVPTQNAGKLEESICIIIDNEQNPS